MWSFRYIFSYRKKKKKKKKKKTKYINILIKKNDTINKIDLIIRIKKT